MQPASHRRAIRWRVFPVGACDTDHEMGMTQRRVLILYGTSYGHTQKVAEYVRDGLEASGVVVTLLDGDRWREAGAPGGYNGVVLAASLIRGGHQRCIERYARTYSLALSDMPSAFLSVSASAASSDDEGRADARREMDRFLDGTGWVPRIAETVAGAISYTRYDPFTRWMMRRICRKAGGPTDVTRDHELTDWRQVARIAEGFAALVYGNERERARERQQPRIMGGRKFTGEGEVGLGGSA